MPKKEGGEKGEEGKRESLATPRTSGRRYCDQGRKKADKVETKKSLSKKRYKREGEKGRLIL